MQVPVSIAVVNSEAMAGDTAENSESDVEMLGCQFDGRQARVAQNSAVKLEVAEGSLAPRGEVVDVSGLQVVPYEPPNPEQMQIVPVEVQRRPGQRQNGGRPIAYRTLAKWLSDDVKKLLGRSEHKATWGTHKSYHSRGGGRCFFLALDSCS